MSFRVYNRTVPSPIYLPKADAAPKLRPVPNTMSRAPIQLRPIAWGQPDSALAAMVCQNLAETTPPIQVAPNPLTNARIRRLLRMHHPI